MIANILKTTLIVLGTIAVGRQVGREIEAAFPDEVEVLKSRIRANKQAGYYVKLHTLGLYEDSEVGKIANSLFREHVAAENVTHVYVGVVVPYDGLSEVTYIEGIQQNDGQMVIYVNRKELLAGTNQKFNVLQICEELAKKTGSLVGFNRYDQADDVRE